MRDLLSRHDFPGPEVPIVRGNALAALRSGGQDSAACACIDELMRALDGSLMVINYTRPDFGKGDNSRNCRVFEEEMAAKNIRVTRHVVVDPPPTAPPRADRRG